MSDQLRAALEDSAQGWSNVVEFGLLPRQHHDNARRLADQCNKALAALRASTDAAPADGVALEYVEDLLRDAWAWADGEIKDKISRIAGEVQRMREGAWVPPVHRQLRASMTCGAVTYLPGSNAPTGQATGGPAENSEVAALRASTDAAVAGEDDILPCDVKLPPATTIGAGCSFDTLRLALGVKGRPRHFSEAIAIGRKLDAEDGGYPAPGEPVGLREAVPSISTFANKAMLKEAAKVPEDYPDYGDWPVTLPAGYWRALSTLTRTDEAGTEGEA